MRNLITAMGLEFALLVSALAWCNINLLELIR